MFVDGELKKIVGEGGCYDGSFWMCGDGGGDCEAPAILACFMNSDGDAMVIREPRSGTSIDKSGVE